MSETGLCVVKLGGSLLADPARLRARLADLAAGAEGRCLVVPGGGPFADAVRRAQEALGFDDRLAHRLALDAMGRMAEVFRALEPRLGRLDALPPGPAQAVARVWDPGHLRVGHPEIAETWAVTSDSLALWLARETGALRCILVKSVAAPAGTGPADWARLGLVDAAFPAYAAAFGGGVRIEGPDPSRRAAA